MNEYHFISLFQNENVPVLTVRLTVTLQTGPGPTNPKSSFAATNPKSSFTAR